MGEVIGGKEKNGETNHVIIALKIPPNYTNLIFIPAIKSQIIRQFHTMLYSS